MSFGGQATPGFNNPAEIITGKVIIEGTADGLFIYSGTAGPGNPPVLSAVAPGTTTDPFSNAVQALLTIGLLAGAHTQYDDNGNISIVNTSGDTVIYISPSLQYIGFYPLGLGHGFPIITIAANNGVDPDGFVYQSGFQVWGADGKSNIELTDLSGVPSAFFSTGVAEETAGTSAVIEAELINAGASEQIQWFLTGPRIGIPTTTPGSASFTVAGPFTWLCPPGVTEVTPFNIGGGGGSGSDDTGNPFTSAGGGGGESASQTVGVTPGVTYNGVVGAGGTAGAAGANNPGGAGVASTFTGDTQTVTANGGGGGASGGGSGAGGAGGTGSTNTTHFNGGAGGANSNTGRGGGGGSSGGTASAGNPGVSGSGSGAGGAAVAGGGAGANAPASGAGVAGPTPGGGAAGANSTGTNVPGAAGGTGEVLLAWNAVSYGPSNFVYATMTGEAKDASAGPGGSLVYADLVTGLHDLLNWSAQGLQVNTMIPDDGNTYQTEEIRFVQAANQLINSTSAAQFMTTFDPGVGEYMVEGQILILTTAAAGAPEFQFAGSATMSSFGVAFTEITEGAPGVMENVGTVTALNQNFQGATLNNAGRLYKFEGSFICSATGTLGIFAATTVAADTFTIQKAVTKMIYKPVGST
jgi:hypothetical protein